MKSETENIALNDKELLCRLMCMDDLEYGTIVMDNAFDYLNTCLDNDAWGKQVLTESAHFWIWWRNEWDKRNHLLIKEKNLYDHDYILQPDQRDSLKLIFHKIHDHRYYQIRMSQILWRLVHNRWKDMENSYAEMIGHVIDNK